MTLELPTWMFWLLVSLIILNMVLPAKLRQVNDDLVAEYQKNHEITQKLIDRLIAVIRKKPDPIEKERLPMNDCPKSDLHYPDQNLGYLEWFDWAEEMWKTHKQTKCLGCGLYKIWTPKKPAAPKTIEKGKTTDG